MEAPGHIQTARDAFAQIGARFPHLRSEDLGLREVDLGLVFPVQPGLKYEVYLNLQDDELHLIVGEFWMEWFPCTDPAKLSAYVSAVVGFLSGEYRVLEHFRGRRCVKAELQKPGANWETVATWRRLHLPLPLRTKQEVRRNA